MTSDYTTTFLNKEPKPEAEVSNSGAVTWIVPVRAFAKDPGRLADGLVAAPI